LPRHFLKRPDDKIAALEEASIESRRHLQPAQTSREPVSGAWLLNSG
jgi:hypothetical protein